MSEGLSTWPVVLRCVLKTWSPVFDASYSIHHKEILGAEWYREEWSERCAMRVKPIFTNGECLLLIYYESYPSCS